MKFPVEPRQLKLGLSGFALVFLVSLLALKPYLPSAIYHNFATIYDYQFFENRVVRHRVPVGWERSENSVAPPSAETDALLGSLETTALLMIQDGKIAYERYSGDGGVGVLSGSFSMAKSIVAILTGIALSEGKIKNLDQQVREFLPEWEDREAGKIKIRDLLQMTSGLDWNETYSNPFSITTESYYGTNLMGTLLRQGIAFQPGSRFSYQSGTTGILGLVLARSVNRNLSDFASQALWAPLGAESDALWSIDHPDGTEKSFCCFNATARDFARIGQLVLDQGLVRGHRILDEDYLRQMTSPHGVVNGEGKPVDYYGYQWWILKTPRGDVPYARGILGQAILVLPSVHRVIVRLGKATGERVDHHPVEVRKLAEWGLGV